MKAFFTVSYLFKFTISIGGFLFSLLTSTPTLGQQTEGPTVGLTVDYYRGYFYDDFSFFKKNKPAVVERSVDNLQFILAETDNFTIGPVATYYSPGKPDEFSARFQGKIYITTPGTYTFYLGSDDAAALWLDADSRPVMRNEGDMKSFQHAQATKVLSTGFHTILLYYGEHGGSQGLVLEYAGPDMARQVVPNGVFYPSNNAAALPVLTDFTVAARGQEVALTWATLTEKDSRYFIVERSIDGNNFQDLHRQSGAGFSTDPHSYQDLDQEAPIGLVYYRVRQELSGGKQVYSPIKAVTVEKAPPVTFSIYPNPNAGKFYLEIQQATSQPCTLELIDMSGRSQYQQVLLANYGAPYHIVPHLATGMYIMRLKTATDVLTHKLVIAK
ncbi:MAG TPA: T9SS type A sorting domain-containing protein [Hymenobacter sp.]